MATKPTKLDEIIKKLQEIQTAMGVEIPALKDAIEAFQSNKSDYDEMLKAKEQLEKLKKQVGTETTKKGLLEQIDDLKSQIEQLIEEKKVAEEKIKSLEAEVASITEEKERIQNLFAEKEKAVYDPLLGLSSTLENLDLTGVGVDASKIQQVVDELKVQLQEAIKNLPEGGEVVPLVVPLTDEEREALNAKIAELSSTVEDLKKQLEEAGTNIDSDAAEQIKDLEFQLETLNSDYIKDSEQYEAEKMRYEDSILELTGEVDRLTEELKALKESGVVDADSEKRIEELTGKLEALQEEYADEVLALRAEKSSLSTENSRLQEQLERSESDKKAAVDKYRRKFKDAKAELEDVKADWAADHAKLTADLATLTGKTPEEIVAILNRADITPEKLTELHEQIEELTEKYSEADKENNYNKTLLNIFSDTLRNAGIISAGAVITNEDIKKLIESNKQLEARVAERDELVKSFINAFSKRGINLRGFSSEEASQLSDDSVSSDDKKKIIEGTARRVHRSATAHKIAAGALSVCFLLSGGHAIFASVAKNTRLETQGTTITEQNTTISNLENEMNYYFDNFGDSIKIFSDYIEGQTNGENSAISQDAKDEIQSFINSLRLKIEVTTEEKEVDGEKTIDYVAKFVEAKDENGNPILDENGKPTYVQETDKDRLGIADNLETMLNSIEKLKLNGATTEKYTDEDVKSLITFIQVLENTKSLYASMVASLNDGTLTPEEYAKKLEDSGELKIQLDALDVAESAAIETFNSLQNKYEMIKDSDGKVVIIEKENWLSTGKVVEMATKYYTMEKTKDNFVQLVKDINTNISSLLTKYLAGETLTDEDIENAKKLESLTAMVEAEYAEKYGNTDGFTTIAESLSAIVDKTKTLAETNANALEAIAKAEAAQKAAEEAQAAAEAKAATEEEARIAAEEAKAKAEESQAKAEEAQAKAEALAQEYVETLQTIASGIDNMFTTDENGERVLSGTYKITDENGEEKEVDATEYLQKTFANLSIKMGEDVYDTLGNDLSKLIVKVIVSDEDLLMDSTLIRVLYNELTGISPDNMTDEQIRAYFVAKYNLDLSGNTNAPTTPGEKDEAKQPGNND